MKDAAHAELLEHEVFQKPFKIEPDFEQWDTPWNYHDRNLSEEKLPDKMKVWRVQNIGQRSGSVVARSYGFNDSPDAEVLVKGFNTGKEYGAVGVGRHGNFLQWGYSASPSKMTEAGRKFFLNCICYIHKFDRKAPLIRRASSHRWNAIRLAAVFDRIKDKNFFSGTFSPELIKKYEGNADGLVRYYKNDFEFIYQDRTFQIDKELKSLGLSSNRTLESLERLIDLLNDETEADKARLLLKRYTNRSFHDAGDWKQWFESNRDRIYFSDVGGYKFLVIPEGYLETK
jgi:hypothetical protein